jgi:transcriptional regulator with XRE-family HTH domain
MVMQVGERLRAARQGQGLSLRELAARADVSASLLSQIENGKVNPTVMSIYSIAGALGLPVDHFFALEERNGTVRTEEHAPAERALVRSVAEGNFSDAVSYAAAGENTAAAHRNAEGQPAGDAQRGRRLPFDPLVRRAERATIELMDGVVWARLTPTAEPAAEFLEVTYPPGATSGPAMSQHAGREFQLVLSGELTLELAFERHVLHAGDSIIFDSTVPHRLVNNGSEPMRAISVVLNP